VEEVKCPYCEKYVEINTDDHYEGYNEYECPECKKHFEVFAEAVMEYSVCGRAKCLNGGEHIWKQKVGYPKWYFAGKYVCETCSAEKTVKEEQMTKEQWEEKQ